MAVSIKQPKGGNHANEGSVLFAGAFGWVFFGSEAITIPL
jgi:hypothetical protein